MMNAPYHDIASLFNQQDMMFTSVPAVAPQQQQHQPPLRSSSPSNSISATSTSSSAAFPVKLHSMLADSAALGFDDVICWLPGGQAFKVLDPKRFSQEIMPRYFSQTKYKSFQRQLNIYGFQRVHHGSHKGGYTHKYCIQGVPDLCERIKREGSANGITVPLASPATAAPQRPSHKRVISYDTRDHNRGRASLTAELLAPVDDFSWDVETEDAFGNNNSAPDSFESTIDDIAAFATSMARGYDDSNTCNYQQQQPAPVTSHSSLTYDSTPLPLKPEYTKRGSSASVLNHDDLAFFKNLFQPGDAAQEKEILDSFNLDSNIQPVQEQECYQQQAPPQMTHQPPVAPMHYTAPLAHPPAVHQPMAPVHTQMPMATTSATTSVAPLMTAGAVSEYNFPRKLYRLLMDCDSNPEYHSIVSWSADGKSFKVHDKKRFVSVILPNYFDQTQYASFRRQLNMYSFLRQSMSTYANPFFMRGHRELIDNVVRKNSSGSNKD